MGPIWPGKPAWQEFSSSVKMGFSGRLENPTTGKTPPLRLTDRIRTWKKILLGSPFFGWFGVRYMKISYMRLTLRFLKVGPVCSALGPTFNVGPTFTSGFGGTGAHPLMGPSFNWDLLLTRPTLKKRRVGFGRRKLHIWKKLARK